MKSSSKPIIAIVMGDAAGIGPELLIKAMGKEEITSSCRPFVIGSADIMERTAKAIGSDVHFTRIESVAELKDHNTDAIRILDCEVERNTNFQWKIADAVNGKNAIAYIRAAVELAMSHEIDGVVLVPLNKESMHKAGMEFPDEGTLMANLVGSDLVKIVVKWNNIFRSTVVGHVAFREIAEKITKDRITPVIRLLDSTIRFFGGSSPRIGVAALNPHGGEGGAFGDEEVREIKPAVEEAQHAGISVSGPFPADTIFVRAMNGQFDGVVFLYHDQGNIAMKSAAFGEGMLLIYSGLPFPCTSPAHGTAYDKAGEGRANSASFEESLITSVTMAQQSSQ